jgi:uncharacterized protein YdhG (YjbR/CyaY superfamily)
VAKYGTVEEYMAGLPEDRRAAMEQLRRTIRAAAPEATDAISYNMPAFRLNGRFFASYEAFKDHYSLFPRTDEMVNDLGGELRPHAVGKGTLRFPADERMPLDLVRRIIEIRLREFVREAEASEP